MRVVDDVKQRYQRGSSPPGSHVGRAKIGNNGNSKPGRYHRTIANLPCSSDGPPQKRSWIALMIESLPMAADKACATLVTLEGFSHRVGVKLRQQKVES